MRTLILAAAAALALPAAASAQSSPTFPEEMDENIARSLEAELYFYAALFGFPATPPDPPIVIDNH